jgi:hypothetical protein
MLGQRRSRLPDWAIPLLYSIAAIFATFSLPRMEHRFLPGFNSEMSAPAAMAIYTSVGTGMLALTGIVFALAFMRCSLARRLTRHVLSFGSRAIP